MSTLSYPHDDPSVRPELLPGKRDFRGITRQVSGIVEARTPGPWKLALAFTVLIKSAMDISRPKPTNK